jgi:hypothetical protein
MKLVVPKKSAVTILRWVVMLGVAAAAEFRMGRAIATPDGKGRKSEWSELPEKWALEMKFD